jgi:deoxyribodipyrimidine photo-lyase
MRMIYQYTNQHYENSKTNVRFSILYLELALPFYTKFEDECRMEFENVNRAYDTLVKPK